MKNKNEKTKIVSFLLAFSMIFSLFIPTMEVLAEENQETLKQENLIEVVDTTSEEETSEVDSTETENNIESEESTEGNLEDSEKVKEEVVEAEEVSNEEIEEKEVDIKEKKVTILGTTDLHGRFISYDYASISDVDGGLDQVATIVKEERAKDSNLLLVDNGDTVQGNYNHLFKGQVNPMVKAMGIIGYDVFSFGNHEFNAGLAEINNFMTNGVSNSKLNFLCANLYNESTNKRVYNPYVIKNVDGVKVAIIGVVSPNIVNWDAANLKGYKTTNPDKEVQKVISEIKDNGGADLYFVTAHMGLDNEYGNGDSARDVANANPEVSGVIAGHSHSVVNSLEINNAVISQPKNNGGGVSKYEFTLKDEGTGYKVIDKKASVIETKGKTKDSEIRTALKEAHEIAYNDANGVIGVLDKDLADKDEVNGIPQSYVSDQGVTDLVNKVQLYYSEKAIKELKDYDKNAYHVSGSALTQNSSNLKAGNITKAGIAGVYKFDNKLYTIKTTGKQLKKYLEWSAEFFNTYNNGDLTISFNPDVRSYNYDMLDGVKYEINISKPIGSRIENLSFEKDGKLVDDTDSVYLTVNDYRYNSVLNATVFDEGEHVKVQDTTNDTLSDIRDMISEYINVVKEGKLTREVDNNWKITGNDWSSEQRELAVKLINEGKIKLPTSEDGRTPNVKSVTWNDVQKALGIKTIDILNVTDFHGAISESGKNIGAAKLAAEIKRLKNENSIFVGAGDLYQGSALSNLLSGEPVSEVFKAMGMKYSAVGNHEFDWGLGNFDKWSENLTFLAANIYDKTTGEPVNWAKPYAIEEIDGVKIGFIGLATPETAYKTTPENVKDLEFKDPTEIANKLAKDLKENKSVDVVIALTHLGGEQSSDGVISGELADFANGAKDIDGIIGGHSHMYVSGTINGIPVIQAGNNGRAVGKLSISVENNGTIKVVGDVDQLYTRVDTLPVDEEVKSIVEQYEEKLNPILGEVVFNVDTDLSHDRTFNGVTKLGQFMTKYMAEVSDVQIALTNAGGLRKPLPSGDITVGDMWDVLPFDNTLVTMKLKGSDLKRVIEHGVMNTNVGWVQFYGLKVFYDSTKETGDRISSMRLLDGTKVEMDKYYTVVTNDFMYAGGDNYDFTGAIDVLDDGKALRDTLMERFKELKNISFSFDDKAAIDGEDTIVDDKLELPEDNTEVDPENKPEDNTGNNQQNKPNNKPGTLPDTGDLGAVPYGIVSLMAISAIIAVNKKKKSS